MLVALVGACLGIAAVAPAQPLEVAHSQRSADANVIEGRYIVVYGDIDQRVRAETTEREAELGFEATQRYTNAIDGFAARLTPSQVQMLNRDPEVEFVSEDRRVEARGYVPLAPGEPTPPTGVRRILAGTSDTAREPSGTSVAVIDTGIQLDHPDLNVADGRDCIQPGTPASDANGHGTHVAGTIAAKNDGAGVVGVAPGTMVYAVRVLDAGGSGTDSEVICGIDWVTANASDLDIGVANMSLGGLGPPLQACETTTDAMHEAICNSTEAGVNYVAAAGNDGWDFDSSEAPDTPAAYPEVLATTAVSDGDGAPGATGGSPSCSEWDDGSRDDWPAWFSNFAATAAGRAHTIAAPGVCITSTWRQSGYETISGTSMASPHAAGVAALCVDEAGTDGPCANLTSEEVIAELRSQADSYNTAHPSYGFVRDPQHSPTPAYFGFLAVAPGAGPPPPSPPLPSAPANDDFADAEDLGQGSSTTDGTNLAATKESDEPDHAGNAGGASVWYEWRALSSGEYRLDTCGSDFDTLLAVYAGSRLDALTPVVSNDDACGLRSRVSFNATAGLTYRIAVDGWSASSLAAEGAIELRLTPRPAAPPSPPPEDVAPSNDFRFGKVRRNKRRGTAKLAVIVPGAGELALRGTKKVRAAATHADSGGEVKVPVKPKSKARAELRESGKTKVRAQVTFAPQGGRPATQTALVKLVKRR